MIHFIIVDDNETFLKEVVSIVDKKMLKTDFEYKIFQFTEYNEEFNQLAQKNIENKVYILDIETKTKNGIDVAREIRNRDLDSNIIFLTAHENYGNKILKSMIQIFIFIFKGDPFESILEQTITELLSRMMKNKNLIKFQDNNSFYAIPLSKILYITTNKETRKTIIHTDFKTIYCNHTLQQFEQDHANVLIRTHKSCIVNLNRSIDFDFKELKIYFDNKSYIDLLSKKYKKEIEKKVLQNNK